MPTFFPSSITCTIPSETDSQASHSPEPTSAACRAERALRRLSPAMAEAAALMAEAFFPAHGGACPDTELLRPELLRPELLRRSGSESLRCSQLNTGDRFEMACSLAADKEEWASLFPGEVSDQVRTDALRELANCICGSLLSHTDLMDEIGCLTPGVPSAFASRTVPGASAIRGALRVSGTRILYSFSLREIPGEPLDGSVS